MRNSTASAGAVNTECAESTDPGEQLRLRFFQVIGAYRSNPPEKALIRELLDCALRNVERFMVGGRAVAAHAVHHVALALYCRTDPAGIVEGFSVKVIAADTRLNERTVRPALDVLRRLHVFRSTRTSRRRPASHRINVGGLDWPAVRERGKRASADTMPALGVSADTMPALSADTMPALKGYNGRARTYGQRWRISRGRSARSVPRAGDRPGVRPAGRLSVVPEVRDRRTGVLSVLGGALPARSRR